MAFSEYMNFNKKKIHLEKFVKLKQYEWRMKISQRPEIPHRFEIELRYCCNLLLNSGTYLTFCSINNYELLVCTSMSCACGLNHQAAPLSYEPEGGIMRTWPKFEFILFEVDNRMYLVYWQDLLFVKVTITAMLRSLTNRNFRVLFRFN